MSSIILFKRMSVIPALFALLLVALVLTRSSAGFRGGSQSATQNFQEQLAREIGGPDLNQNGIRDDVERWIDERFDRAAPDRQAFLQLATDYQRVLLTTADPR